MKPTKVTNAIRSLRFAHGEMTQADLADLFAHFLTPTIAGAISPFVLAPAAVGELSFIAWLLVKVVRVPERDPRVPVTA